MTNFLTHQELIFEKAELMNQQFSESERSFLKKLRLVINGLKELGMLNSGTADEISV